MELEKLLGYCHGTGNGLYIYGAGIYGKRLACFLRQKNIPIQGFIETKQKNTVFRGIPIYSADAIKWDNDPKIVIGVSRKYLGEILNTLRSHGYEKEFIATEKIHEYVKKM